MTVERPDYRRIYEGLKDFQRETAEYAFRRMYLDQDPARRFLIADEVGLGKTLVARGLIARAVDRLWNSTNRIDVVYICSNGDIARQNISRLNITGEKDFALASRITLLPIHVADLSRNHTNFVSFTPGTSFDLGSHMGRGEERALLYWLLDRIWHVRAHPEALGVLQGAKGEESFRVLVEHFPKDYGKIDKDLAELFARKVDQQGLEFRNRWNDLCARFGRHGDLDGPEDRNVRSQFIGELRYLLAGVCLDALNPALIILDEFQRFKHLLRPQEQVGQLASQLFDWSNKNPNARVLLLSATPYKMYTLYDESGDDDHYQDFLDTLRFLDRRMTDRTAAMLHDYREEILRTDSSRPDNLVAIKEALQHELRQVMTRTERLSVADDRDGMLKVVHPGGQLQLTTQDLQAYVASEQVAESLQHDSVIEFWKSAPYLLNLMDDYVLKKSFRKALEDRERQAILTQIIAGTPGLVLPWQDIQRYRRVDPGNVRLRYLMRATVENLAWMMLWIPPALPYYSLRGVFADPRLTLFSKHLVFSAWQVVPKVITTLVSYEAERHMMRMVDTDVQNTPTALKARRGRLRFARSDSHLTGMPLMALMYPCLYLAHDCDPLREIAVAGRRKVVSAKEMVDNLTRFIQKRLDSMKPPGASDGPEDDRWYWIAPILLDLNDARYKQRTRDWWLQKNLPDHWSPSLGEDRNKSGTLPDAEDSDTDATAWAEHVYEAQGVVYDYFDRDSHLSDMTLGRRPEQLARVLAHLALAGWGVVALRSLARAAGGMQAAGRLFVRNAAARVARSFVTLFNLPDTISLLQGLNRQEPYWFTVLEYCVDGCLQSVLDEYTHLLVEGLGILDPVSEAAEEVVEEIAAELTSVLTLRAAVLNVDQINVPLNGKSVTMTQESMRGRYALRFVQEKAEGGETATHADRVRAAFNSPFWPFVLATTSVGQEGLDFHPYCHVVVHWNLPPNPVDLEQREGRVHRYKGHAVRKNLAARFGDRVWAEGLPDCTEHQPNPWPLLFELACAARPSGQSDIVPFWVYCDGEARIERHVPALPLSRDQERLAALRRSLVVYRMAFGQNRQEDLLEYLLARFPDDQDRARLVSELRIDLSPPKR